MTTKTAKQKSLDFARNGKPWSSAGIVRKGAPAPIFTTSHGILFQDDCLRILPRVETESIDMVFADPPFNVGKHYGNDVDDERPATEYLDWYKRWVSECVRILKPGGSLFIYNLPKWNVLIGPHLAEHGMTFRHWIAVSIKTILPIAGRLYPCHYSLLYYCKGPRPKTFRSIRTPIKTCRHCGGEIKDYGGHRGAMNPKGVNLTDVWDDIPPVRHWKFKSKKRKANQLSTKLVSRAIELSTRPGDLVLDPFGGAGTTFDVCETTCRNWIGVELENCDVIVERLTSGTLAQHKTTDHIEG